MDHLSTLSSVQFLVDNLLAENPLQEPNDDAEHAIIEIGKTADENVLQNLTNVDNDESRQGMILLL